MDKICERYISVLNNIEELQKVYHENRLFTLNTGAILEETEFVIQDMCNLVQEKKRIEIDYPDCICELLI